MQGELEEVKITNSIILSKIDYSFCSEEKKNAMAITTTSEQISLVYG